jgi:hypothetical protein
LIGYGRLVEGEFPTDVEAIDEGGGQVLVREARQNYSPVSQSFVSRFWRQLSHGPANYAGVVYQAEAQEGTEEEPTEVAAPPPPPPVGIFLNIL